MLHLGITNGDGFDAASSNYDMVAVVISRREVESGSVGDVVDRLMKLSDSKENVLKFESSLIISFDGYNDDPRPIGAIPECVRFFRQVHAHWPYWYHFLVKVPDMFSVLLSLLMDTEVVTNGHGVVAHEVSSGTDIRRQLVSLFVPMNNLYEAFSIGEAENRRMTDEVCAVLEKCLR